MPIQPGEPAPEIVAIDHEGTPWRLSEHRGRPMVLLFHRHAA